jgi:hypothetical protein
MDVSRREFGASLGALLGGLVLFKKVPGVTGSPAAEKFNEHSHETMEPSGLSMAMNTVMLSGKVTSPPSLRHYKTGAMTDGYRLFFTLRCDRKQVPVVVWGQKALDCHKQIHHGSLLRMSGSLISDKLANGQDFYHVVLDQVEVTGRRAV